MECFAGVCGWHCQLSTGLHLLEAVHHKAELFLSEARRLRNDFAILPEDQIPNGLDRRWRRLALPPVSVGLASVIS